MMAPATSRKIPTVVEDRFRDTPAPQVIGCPLLAQ